MPTLTVTTVRKNRVQVVARREGQLVGLPDVLTPADGKSIRKIAKKHPKVAAFRSMMASILRRERASFTEGNKK